ARVRRRHSPGSAPTLCLAEVYGKAMSRSAAIKISLGLGLAYLLIGVLGFIPGITQPSSAPGQGLLLGIFAVNTVHNLAHLVLGAALVWTATTGSNVLAVSRANG